MGKPVRLTPSLREKVWGKTRLAPWFPDSAERMGEAWYLADCELPLLVKLIFTSERLSVQVHPDDGEDGPRGKTEMWHIMAADPGSTSALGFREEVTKEQLRQAIADGSVEDLLSLIEVKPGDTFFAEAGTVTRVVSESFAGLADREPTVEMEVRASWTPRGEIGAHLLAWSDLLCTIAGLPPLPEGVVALPGQRR